MPARSVEWDPADRAAIIAARFADPRPPRPTDTTRQINHFADRYDRPDWQVRTELGRIDAAIAMFTGHTPDPEDTEWPTADVLIQVARSGRAAGLIPAGPDIPTLVATIVGPDAPAIIDATIATRTVGLPRPPGDIPDATIGTILIVTGPVGARRADWQRGHVNLVCFAAEGPPTHHTAPHFLDELAERTALRPWRIPARPLWTATDVALDGSNPLLTRWQAHAARRSGNTAGAAVAVTDPTPDRPHGHFPPPAATVPLDRPGRQRRRRGLGHLNDTALADAVTRQADRAAQTHLDTQGLRVDRVGPGHLRTADGTTVAVVGSTGSPGEVIVPTHLLRSGGLLAVVDDIHVDPDTMDAHGGRVRVGPTGPHQWTPIMWTTSRP